MKDQSTIEATGHFQAVFSSKFSGVVSWLSAFLGFGTVAGFVNVVVGFLSACWLSAQLWNYFTYTLPKNRFELAEFKRNLKQK